MLALGGDIQCRSEHGRFTEFTLSFPPALANEPSLAPAPAPHRPLVGLTALVVDDQALNRAIARALARDLGLRTLEAEHGQQALDMLRSGVVPDAILMDINMPGLDGIATTRLLRELPGAAARVPVLALTANDSPAVLAAARAGGLHAVLIKPIDAAALEHALISALQGSGDPSVSPLAPSASELLNTRRVDDFGRLGLMDELPGALMDMRGHLRALEQAEALDDLDAARDALHALVGLSGECGAKALHGLARRRYAALLDGQASSAPVATELRALLEATEQALAQRYGVQVPA
ncbi:MAG: response regulator [Bradyrhizobium sp.]